MLEKKVDVLISEMSAIRNEINSTKETVHNILNFFFVLIGTEVSLFIAAWDSFVDFDSIFVRILILSIPFPFMCLSMYHTECIIRIHNYIQYVDCNIRNRIKELLGEPLLNVKSKTATKSIMDVLKKGPLDAKLGYLSKFGLKLMSMLFPLFFYIYMVQRMQINMEPVECIVIAVDVTFIVALFFMQHD